MVQIKRRLDSYIKKYDGSIWVYEEEYYNNTNFVEDDWVTVYGVCAGSYTYKTTSGGTYTVPSMYGAILQ